MSDYAPWPALCPACTEPRATMPGKPYCDRHMEDKTDPGVRRAKCDHPECRTFGACARIYHGTENWPGDEP